MAESILLLERRNSASTEPIAGLRICGSEWVLVERNFDCWESVDFEYTCVSYSWGVGRSLNPLFPQQSISDRALPAFESTLKSLSPNAIWIDAFCVPIEAEFHISCLRNLGKIYGHAKEVAVVLSRACAPLIDQISRLKSLEVSLLPILDNDDWVTRIWTYQEMVNSRKMAFLGEGDSGAEIDGQSFLSAVGSAMSELKQSLGMDTAALRVRYPRLDSLEDLIADWLMADYLERSAYQAMSAMDRRVAIQSEEVFLAMIGAINASPCASRNELLLHPAEQFMKACEEKGDYSFLYCRAPRSQIPGRGWRPEIGPMPTVFPFHTFGDGQPGALFSSFLRLDEMCVLKQGKIRTESKHFLEKWLKVDVLDLPISILASQAFSQLRQFDFAGSGDYLELEEGLFFPQTHCEEQESLVVAIAAGIRWAHGALGMLAEPLEPDLLAWRTPGVFVGLVPAESVSLLLA